MFHHVDLRMVTWCLFLKPNVATSVEEIRCGDTRVGKNLGGSNITCVAELKDQKESYRGDYSQEELTECSN